MFDIVALGELLVDFTPAGISEQNMKLFEQNPGGAPANLLVCAQKLGLKTAFLGKVGADMHGDFLRATLHTHGVNVDGLKTDEHTFTTLAFVDLSPTGERTFSFARKPGADTMLTENDVQTEIIAKAKIFHCGSLSLTDSPSRQATWYAVKTAKEANVLISYDPNYRQSLWKNQKTAIEHMRSVIPFVDIIKISDEETELVTGFSDVQKAADFLLNSGIQIAIITLGAKGAFVATKEGSGTVPCFNTKRVDTTGAGDSFFGGFLSAFIMSNLDLKAVSINHVLTFARFANAVASLCVQKRGGIPSMPDLESVQKLLNTP